MTSEIEKAARLIYDEPTSADGASLVSLVAKDSEALVLDAIGRGILAGRRMGLEMAAVEFDRLCDTAPNEGVAVIGRAAAEYIRSLMQKEEPG